MIIQHWGCIVLTDTQGPDTIREFSYHGRQWTIIQRGRVAFLLEDIWTTWWKSGGARIYSTSPRVAGLQFTRQGWRRGMFITGIYAPTSDSSVEERQILRDQVNQISEMSTATSISIIAGDFNAELGNSLETQTPGTEALGRFANSRVSTAGREWRQWATQQGYKECSSRFQLRHRCTWKHPRFSTEHELDHFFSFTTHLWHLVSCRILQEGPNVDWPWSAYTDHNPVELTPRHGKMWGRNKSHNTIPAKPDVQKLRGPSAEASRLRQMWTEAVETYLEEAPPASSLQARWDQVSALCREKAVQICGALARRTGAPWLAEKETEVKQLDTWISEAQEADRQIRNNPHNLPPEEWTQQKRRKRHQLQAARQHKAQTLQQWEENWLTQQAHLADQASARHDMGYCISHRKGPSKRGGHTTQVWLSHRTSSGGDRGRMETTFSSHTTRQDHCTRRVLAGYPTTCYRGNMVK